MYTGLDSDMTNLQIAITSSTPLRGALYNLNHLVQI